MNKMLSMMSVIFIAVFQAMLMSGCGDSCSSKPLQTKDGDEVLAVFNGHKLYKRDIGNYSRLRREMYKLLKPDADANSLAKVEKSSAGACLPYFIQNVILYSESAAYQKGHGAYADADRKKVRSWLLKQYSKIESDGKRAPSFASIRSALSRLGLADEFDKQIQSEIDSELYLRVACSNRFQITESVITNVYYEWIANNYVAAQTNRVILALSSNVVNRIRAGEDFQELADRYTMVPEESGGGDMGFCEEADFPGEEELWDAVKGLDAGEVTGIIDAGDSWQILKVIERDDSNPKTPKLHLGRIYFRRAWEIQQPSRADVVEALEDDRRHRLLKEILEKRLAVSKIEFPKGRQVFLDLTPAKPFLDIIEGRATNLVNKTSGKLQ